MSPSGELVIQTPDGQTRSVPLLSERIGLGRSSTNELCYPDDAGLSRQHLVFEKTGNDWFVRDLGSKNGTQVNGQRLAAAHPLKPGDRIAAGHLVIQYKTMEEATPMQTVFFVADTVSPASTTVATDLEGVLAKSTATQGGPTPLSAGKSVQALIRAGQELSSHRPLAELFPLILDLSIDAVGATRGVLMALDQGQLVVKAAHGKDFQISTGVRDRVVKERKSLLVHDAQFDAELAGRQSIVMQGMRSILAVPLQTRETVLGLIYVDTQDLIRPFGEEDLNLLTVMANVAAMRIEQARLAEIEEQERLMARELSQAAEIQRGLLPAAAPNIPGLDIGGQNLPCRGVGGDYYDYFTLADERIGFVVADVAGKGMPAAMMMSNMQAHMQVLTEAMASPAQIVKRLNKSVAARCPGNRFITFFMAAIDPQTGELEYCNAGHNPPLLVRKDGKIEMLEGGGMILGIYGGADYESFKIKMEPGDMLAMFSDGVTEACAYGTEEEFGEQRLGEIIHAHRGQKTSEVILSVMTTLQEWAQGQHYADDVTLVVVSRKGDPPVQSPLETATSHMPAV